MTKLRNERVGTPHPKSEGEKTRGVIEEIDLCLDHMINDGSIYFPTLRDDNSIDPSTLDLAAKYGDIEREQEAYEEMP